MADLSKKQSSLQRRIVAGKADPISARERDQLQELRTAYKARFGKDPDLRLPAKTPSR